MQMMAEGQRTVTDGVVGLNVIDILTALNILQMQTFPKARRSQGRMGTTLTQLGPERVTQEKSPQRLQALIPGLFE